MMGDSERSRLNTRIKQITVKIPNSVNWDRVRSPAGPYATLLTTELRRNPYALLSNHIQLQRNSKENTIPAIYTALIYLNLILKCFITNT
jgi:hypothetical protein